MICLWSHGEHRYEFDAKNKADELHKAREWAKENGWKMEDMVKEK